MKQLGNLAIIIAVILVISVFNKYDTFETYTEPTGTTTTYTTTTSSTTTNRGPSDTEIVLIVLYSISVAVLLLFALIVIEASNWFLTPRIVNPHTNGASSKHTKKKPLKV